MTLNTNLDNCVNTNFRNTLGLINVVLGYIVFANNKSLFLNFLIKLLSAFHFPFDILHLTSTSKQ